MTTYSRTLKLTKEVYERLGRPTYVDMIFLGSDLLICAGSKYGVRALAVTSPNKPMLIKKGTFTTDVEFLCGRWTAVVRDCTHHFYLEHTPYGGHNKAQPR